MRNAEATKERILEAALAEFSTHGIAGARVDRIAQAAACNKNLIYVYFTDKETLFKTVLRMHLSRVHEEQPFTPGDLPGFAAQVFDIAMANPALMRLLAWSALEQNPKDHAENVGTLDEKIRALTDAQKAGEVGTTFPAEFLLTAILSVATAWSAASAFGASINPRGTKRESEVRKYLVEAVHLLAASTRRKRKP